MLARSKEHIHLLYDLRTILLHPICFNFPFVCLTNSLSLHVTGKLASIKKPSNGLLSISNHGVPYYSYDVK